MTYSVYATLPDGRKLKYGKKLNTVSEVNDAMNEMKKDLKDAGITAKVGYQNDNPPAPSRATTRKNQPKAAPKTPAKKTSKPDPLDRNLKDEISKSKSRTARLIADAIRPNVTLRQVVDSINKDGDTFKLVTGKSIQITETGMGVQWSRKDEYIVDAVCVAVARALGRRQYDVKSAWNYLGEYGNRANFGKRSTAQLTKKEKEIIPPGELPKVGDVFYSSWGYDQTNIDFYVVEATKGKTMCYLVPVGNKTVENQGSADYVVPVIGTSPGYSRYGKGVWKKYNPKYKSFTMSSYETAHKWDGKPKYQTAFGYGH